MLDDCRGGSLVDEPLGWIHPVAPPLIKGVSTTDRGFIFALKHSSLLDFMVNTPIRLKIETATWQGVVK